VAFTDLVDYVNVVVAGYCFAVAVVAVGLAGFVAAGRAVAGCVDHPAAVVVVGHFSGFGSVVFADSDFFAVGLVAVAVVAAVSVGLAVDY